MYLSGPQKRITGAILAGTAIIAGALLLRDTSDPLAAATVINGEAVVVTTAPKRSAIPISDSNGDGVADWQESLQKTEPIAVSQNASSSFDAPDTLTEQFALEFFEQMVRNETNGEFGKDPQAFVSAFNGALVNQASDELLGRDDIRTTDNNSPSTLTQYGEAVAVVMNRHNEESNENEAVILERALRDGNAAELAKLDGKIQVYSNLLKDTAALEVPNRVAAEHLALLNAYQALLTDIAAMQRAFDDPMKALLRMKRYQDDATGLTMAISNLYTALLDNGASWPADSVVFSIIKIDQ